MIIPFKVDNHDAFEGYTLFLEESPPGAALAGGPYPGGPSRWV